MIAESDYTAPHAIIQIVLSRAELNHTISSTSLFFLSFAPPQTLGLLEKALRLDLLSPISSTPRLEPMWTFLLVRIDIKLNSTRERLTVSLNERPPVPLSAGKSAQLRMQLQQQQ